ncbi:MAG: CoxG family protein [Gammaproteobacteria bacterium]
MKIEKQFIVDAPQQQVWQFITTPEQVGPCIPGCQEVTAVDPSHYKVSIRVQVGPIKTTFNVNVEATEERPPEYSAYTTRGEEGGKASRIKAESTLRLRALDANRTEVMYTSDINIVGRLGKFGLGIMKKKADSMGGEFVEAVRAGIEGRADERPREVAAGGIFADLLAKPKLLWGTAITAMLLILLLYLNYG